jgi:hypothetical protein
MTRLMTRTTECSKIFDGICPFSATWYNVIKQINTNIFLRLTAEIIDNVSSIPSDFKKDLPNFGKE